jgi:hypothetical protein
VSEALGKAWKTLEEGFAVCDTRQRKLSELYIGNDFFVEYFYRALGKKKIAATVPGNCDGAYAECHKVTLDKGSLFAERIRWHSAKAPSLPSARWISTRQRDHQQVPLLVRLPSAFVGTRQSLLLCRVPKPHHSAKRLYQCPGVPFLLSVMTLTLGKVTSIPLFICFSIPSKQTKDITHNHHIYITDIT